MKVIKIFYTRISPNNYLNILIKECRNLVIRIINTLCLLFLR